VLLAIAFLEVAINRVAIGSRSDPGLATTLLHIGATPPAWHTLLSYVGLFVFYFAGTLAVALALAQAVSALGERRGIRDAIAQVALIAATLLAAVPLAVDAPWLGLPLEVAFAVAVIAVVASGFGRERDLGAQLGLIVLAVPLLVHTVNAIGDKYLWPEGAYDQPGTTVAHAGVLALCFAALLSPYVFAPRPFARAVARPLPVAIAMFVAVATAVPARLWYATMAKAAALAIGVQLDQTQADPRLAIYLLAVATLAWTLASCALAKSPARRAIGAGLLMIVLGGYGFRWSNHYVLPLLGLAIVADATRRVRDEELAALPISSETPAIADAAWASYITAVATTLARTLADVHTLTSRGEGGMSSTLIVGTHDALPVRARIERVDDCVIALDVVLGREYDEVRGATLTLWAIPPRGLGTNPAGPPAAPLFKTGDASFDQRFKSRGSALAFGKILDDGLRARVVATLDGWLAYWEPEGMRYRVYPGRGAPLDHPMPLSDLALGRPASPERLVAVIELLVELAGRGVPTVPLAVPAVLEELP
jgi:hypothetical protein